MTPSSAASPATADVDLERELDAVVVGGGILGLAVARELRRRHEDWRIAVLEREPRIATHQTGRNSGVIHAGIYYAPGSLKARMCRTGAERMVALCERHDVPYERCGKLIVAIERHELDALDELERRGRANGVPGLRRLDGDGLREVEPAGTGIAALHSPATGIVDFGAVAQALAAELTRDGVDVVTDCAVTRIEADRGAARVTHARGVTRARHVVACAGAWSDRLAVASGADVAPRIVPFRGAYLGLRAPARERVRGLIYPVPDPSLPFLGVHVTRRIDGRVLLGPTALLVGARDARRAWSVRTADLRDTLAWPGTWAVGRRWWRTGLDELRMAASPRAFVRACARYLPGLSLADVEPAFSGVRAQAVGRGGDLIDDFVLDRRGPVLHVRNAPSPAATASLALAEEIVDRLADDARYG
jgi:L-2-hydroxyglutarate oxidase